MEIQLNFFEDLSKKSILFYLNKFFLGNTRFPEKNYLRSVKVG